MLRLFTVLCLLCGVCSGLRLRWYLLGIEDEGEMLVDRVINQIPSQIGVSPGFSFQLTSGPNSTVVGDITTGSGNYFFTEVQRDGPVESYFRGGNLTFSTVLSFRDLKAQHEILVDLPGILSARQRGYISSPNNRFKLNATVFTEPTTGNCAIKVWNACFISGDLSFSLSPTGFFNQLGLKGDIIHFTSNLLPKIFLADSDIVSTEALLKQLICADLFHTPYEPTTSTPSTNRPITSARTTLEPTTNRPITSAPTTHVPTMDTPIISLPTTL